MYVYNIFQKKNIQKRLSKQYGQRKKNNGLLPSLLIPKCNFSVKYILGRALISCGRLVKRVLKKIVNLLFSTSSIDENCL